MGEKNQILQRVYIVYFAMSVLGLLIFSRAVLIQVVEGDHWRARAEAATLRFETVEAVRGNIFAEDGRLLATSVPEYDIRMDLDPEVISQQVFRNGIDSLALRLSQLFGNRSPAHYRAVIMNARRNQERYFLLKRNVTHEEMLQLRDFPIFRLGRFRGGLIVVPRTRREMPNRNLAARTIGYMAEGVYVGLEGAFNDVLKGNDGKRLLQRTTGGYWIPIDDAEQIVPENGKDIVTTINITIQDIVENALLSKLHETQAQFGTAVVMEVATGKIRAISNLTRSESGTYSELFNYAIAESSEPGSTFKLASVMALLEHGKVAPEDIVHTGNGEMLFYDRRMRDARKGGFGSITVQHAFEVSSNVGISRLVHQAYKDNPRQFVNQIKEMGLGEKLDIEISGEGSPFITQPGNPSWSRVSLPWMSIGYEVMQTPLQILSFYNAVANGGKKMRPMLVQQISEMGRPIKEFSPQVIDRSIASASTIEKVQRMMEGVVENGTARNIRSPHYRIAGKTGTVQVAYAGRGYRNIEGGRSYRSSFVGYFPANQPVYSCIVIIHNPRGYIFTGGQIAAPVFKEIADRVFATHLQLPPLENPDSVMIQLPSFRNAHRADLRNIYSMFGERFRTNSNQEWFSAQAFGEEIQATPREKAENVIPDVKGMSLSDAIYVLENTGLRVRFNGRGIVASQSIQPGTQLIRGNTILLHLD